MGEADFDEPPKIIVGGKEVPQRPIEWIDVTLVWQPGVFIAGLSEKTPPWLREQMAKGCKLEETEWFNRFAALPQYVLNEEGEVDPDKFKASEEDLSSLDEVAQGRLEEVLQAVKEKAVKEFETHLESVLA